MNCPNCNAEIQGSICEYCGTNIQSYSNLQAQNFKHKSERTHPRISNNMNNHTSNKSTYSRSKKSPKKKSVAIVLCCLSFIGLGGFHRFYVGKKASGFLHLFTVGFMWIGTIIDLISLSKGNFTDSNGLKLK